MTRPLFLVSVAAGYGGAERSIEIMVRHLPPGLHVRIFATHPSHLEQLAPLHAPNVQVCRLLRGSGSIVRGINALRMAFEVRRWQPAAILANTHAGALLIAMAARLLPGVGAITQLYVRDFQWQNFRYLFRRLPGAQVIVPHAVVVARLGYLAPFHVAPLGDARWVELPDMVELPEPAMPCADGPVLHLASVNRWKGHADLLLALHRLKATGRSLKLVSHGPSDDVALEADLAELADRLDLHAQFVLGGYVADPTALLRSCSAVVVSSTMHAGGPETFGRAVIEAWAHCRPVVAYAVGAPASLIEHEIDGLLVPEGDTAALGEALWRLRADPDLARRLGEAGRAKVEARYEAHAVSRRVFDQLLRPPGTRSG